MADEDFSPEAFTADYVGEPGRRTFYLQARESAELHTYVMEKQQVAALAEKLRDLLLVVDQSDTVRSAAPARDPALAISEPLTPEWRVGTIGLAFEENEDLVIVFLEPAGETEDELEEPEERISARFRLRRDQVRAFVLHVAAVVEEGRPTCQLCGLPMDPEGHNCPASNGHRVGS